MSTRYDYYITGDDSGWETGIYGADRWGAQTFTASANYAIHSVKLKLYKIGSPGNITIHIQGVDGSDLPDNTDLAAGTYDGDSLGAATGAWVEIILTSPANLTSGTKYAIVIKALSGDSNNTLCWRRDISSPSYTNGSDKWTIDAGVTWNDTTNYDLMFETYGRAQVAVDKTFSKKLVAVANNEVWYESSAGTMAELNTSGGAIDTTIPLAMFELLEKVFIVNGTNLKVADFGNTKLSTDDIDGGTAVPEPGSVIGKEVTGAISNPKFVVDYVTALTTVANTKVYAKKITAGTISSGDTLRNASGTISFVTDANEVLPTTPHWYDWTVFGNSTTYGVMPEQANEGCNYRGRANLTADKDYPHQWYQSRQKNPWDWNYTDNDAQAPVAGNDADAGEVGDIIVVSIPYKDDYLIHACANTLWYMVGDAASGGSIVELDLTNGILGPRAWCWDNENNLYILGTTGLLKIPAGFGAPENITSLSWPNFIKDLAYNSATHRIVMGFDRIRNGIKISKTTLADGSNSCWWYDFRAEGLFPESYPEECGTYCMFYYESVDPTYSGLLEGDFDGYIRASNDDAVDDDIGDTNEAIDSYYTLGPIRMGKETREGIVTSLLGVPAGGITAGSLTKSSDITWKLWTAETADELVEKLLANTNPKITGTMKALGTIRGARKRREVRGMYAGIRLGNNTAAETWSLERLQMNFKAGGRLK